MCRLFGENHSCLVNLSSLANETHPEVPFGSASSKFDQITFTQQLDELFASALHRLVRGETSASGRFIALACPVRLSCGHLVSRLGLKLIPTPVFHQKG
ncbi:unnamed protein product [Protopolystoma xenopodis]|uniref:Uncharacterized protein n=1 Tax=Protopolystoma xenopodis TaxID=117903 RepID=A0A448WSA3_9PLAT|nr:unnamed protein product [Protopolystoma xenopodis]